MRKLILTSFTAKTGDIEFTEQRIVIIDAKPQSSSEEDREQAALVFIEWFGMNFRDSEILSIVPHDTVQANGLPALPRETPNKVRTWAPLSEIPDRHPDDLGVSINVIIDINGEGDWYDTAWYDFEDKKWVNCNRDFDRAIAEHPELVRWMYGPKENGK